MDTIDEVTGARTGVALRVDLPASRLWELVTDVPRYGHWSPECVHTEWPRDRENRPARAGDRFSGRNRFGNGFVATTFCVVTAVAPGEVFEWVVLDDAEDPTRPGSIWRYELTASGTDRTLLRHVFEHGPGDTGMRLRAAQLPTGPADRLEQIHANMTASLSAMLDGVPFVRDGAEREVTR